MRVLFIGNSHTYVNDMPRLFAELARKDGYSCEVTMITHGGWFLAQHQEDPQTRFNILYGNYDYVVLQEHAHPFGPEEKMINAAKAINQWIREAGSTPVAYMTWSEKVNPEGQARMTAAYEQMAAEIGAVLAPVGVEWWKFMKENPGVEMYAPDGEHASLTGSRLAAEVIWKAIQENLGR
ncbi:MAG: SGNH/GDSL hydrolase family protein [Lachnospiraceae bacterium]|nr:SGNH/GDSL hydrolase family protein [Lachnospiraceae bacterium]